jgi:hypothetical protein
VIAVLDGIRPYYHEYSSQQTAAFHEFVADLTAILSALRDNRLREAVGKRVGADLKRARVIADIGDQLGDYVRGRPDAALRSALEKVGMDALALASLAASC